MKCSKCIEGGKKSTVPPRGLSSTLMGYSPYYDEDGIYHNHDYNTITSTYICSNDHGWAEKIIQRVPIATLEKVFMKSTFLT